MLGPHIQTNPSPIADPRLIVANTIIHYSTAELEQAIIRELDENPALELAERLTCPICTRPLHGSQCVFCSPGGPGERGLRDQSSLVENNFSGALQPDTEDDFDPFWATADPVTLPEYLLGYLRLVLEERDHEIALHVVGNLDAHGYFTSSPEELASALQVEVSRVRGVLEELQDLDPPGIGARTVQECLLLQLQRLERQGVTIPSVTRAIIQDHLEALGHNRFEHIRHALTISREDVQAAFFFIRTNLHPYPAHHYYDESSDPQPTRLRVRPSALIHRRPTEPPSYEVEVVEPQRFLVRMNPLYQQLHQQPHQISTDERKHVVHFLERARIFMSALQRRHDLLQRLVTYLVTFQRDFLDHGPLYLRHLTQTDVARELGIHTSTVSRATSGKFVQLPSQDLLPLQIFFASETRVQDLVRQIILQETIPLSDERIARQLREQHGITVSRQMIANYRADLKIPAARQRALLQRGKRNIE
jgi:RNA polymerase sigma-54 factor